MRFIFFLSVLILMVGCRCGSRIVEPLELGLRVEPDQIDFGRVLEGDTKQATLTLYAETRARVEVALSTEAPFGVEAAAIVPGGGQTTAFVSFHAGNVDATGVIVLIVGERRAEVPVKGTGVRPLECRPSATCIVSTYSLEEDRCIETQAEDDSACDTDSVCLEQGRCRMGQCVGIARKCDDQNTCTDDACAMEIGCVHTPHVCPRPMAACHVATCDPTQGCGEGLAPDFLPCGQQDCIEVNLCVSGACRNLPTPEGLPCSPAVACLPEGQCHNQQCTRPKEADWVADWSAPLAGELTGALASSGSNIFFSTCVDAGEPDAGELDAGQSQGCGLSSYTGTGFERFTHWYDDEAARDVVAIQTAGVVMRGMGALELRSKVTGELTQSLAFVPPSTQLVVDKENIFFWADGGIYAWHDGGTDLVSNTLEPSAMGRGDALFAWNADAGLLTRIDVLTDGGTEVHELLTSGFGSALAIAGDVAVFGTGGSAWLHNRH